MIRRIMVLAPMLVAALVPVAAQQTMTPIDKLSGIAGCVEVAMGRGKSHEQGIRPEGGWMLGMSRTVVNSKTVFVEFLQIKPEGGDLVYVARPQGKEPTPFKLVKLNDAAAIF